MPTVVREGEFSFIIHTRELPFEPPHVHIAFGGEEVRIELVGGTFMDNPPAGKRRAILDVFHRHVVDLRRAWDEIHDPAEEEEGQS